MPDPKAPQSPVDPPKDAAEDEDKRSTDKKGPRPDTDDDQHPGPGRRAGDPPVPGDPESGNPPVPERDIPQDEP